MLIRWHWAFRYRNVLISISIICLSFSCQQEKPDYGHIKTSISSTRDSLATCWRKADSLTRKHVLKESREYLLSSFEDQLFPAWYNTPWNFYGMSEEPGKGTIACGYFVTTTLRDAGFVVPKNAWAQLASESFMGKFTGKEKLKRFSSVKLEEVEKYIRKEGEGLYLVGLDYHVGFILFSGGELSFVHSSYYHPDTGVMRENIYGKNPLNDSRYRVIARLFDDRMLERWLTGYRYQ